jgi:hypothetical protein
MFDVNDPIVVPIESPTNLDLTARTYRLLKLGLGSAFNLPSLVNRKNQPIRAMLWAGSEVRAGASLKRCG